MEFPGVLHAVKHLLTTGRGVEGRPAVPAALGEHKHAVSCTDSTLSTAPTSQKSAAEPAIYNPALRAATGQVNTGGEGRDNRHGRGLELQKEGEVARKRGVRRPNSSSRHPKAASPKALLPLPESVGALAAAEGLRSAPSDATPALPAGAAPTEPFPRSRADPPDRTAPLLPPGRIPPPRTNAEPPGSAHTDRPGTAVTARACRR